MFLTNERSFLYSLYALGLVLWYVLYKFFSNIVGLLVPVHQLGPFTMDQLMALFGLGISMALVQVVWRNQKAKEYGIEVVVETKKVSWPNKKEIQGSTLIVLVMVVITTIIIFMLDKIFDYLIKLFFQI